MSTENWDCMFSAEHHPANTELAVVDEKQSSTNLVFLPATK
jgi:hypothetical protein